MQEHTYIKYFKNNMLYKCPYKENNFICFRLIFLNTRNNFT